MLWFWPFKEFRSGILPDPVEKGVELFLGISINFILPLLFLYVLTRNG